MNANTNTWTPCALFLVLLSTGAQAQTSQTSAMPAKSTSDWNYSLGAAVISAPRFVGSDTRRTLAVPNFQARYKDWLFIDPIRGIGVQTKLTEGLGASAALAIDLASRKRKDDARLTGLGDISEAAALRFGLDYRLGDAFVSANMASRLGKSNGRGTLFDADIGYNVVKSRTALVGVGLNLKGMDSTYARNFFGVSATQSAASGLPVFNADGGLQSMGPFVQAVVPLSERWIFFGRAAYSKLRSDAAASPITQERDQAFLLAAVNYRF